MRKLIISFAALLLLFSCNKTAGPAVFTDFASSVKVSSTENALRYAVELDIRQPADYRIRYWKKADGEASARVTNVYKGEVGKAQRILKFLYPDTAYEFKVEAGEGVFSETYSFTTGTLPPEVPVYHVLLDEGGPSEGYLMQWQATSPGYITFCDMEGTVVWYEEFEQAIRQAYFDPERGEIATTTGFREGSSGKFQRLCDKIIVLDLDGNRSIDWLASDDNVHYPHHEIRIMPDGNLIFFNAVLREFDLTSIGGEADTMVWGDGFTILDRSGKTLKTWDIFNTVDPIRDNDYLHSVDYSHDLVHGNSVNWDSEGNYYITINRLCELWKIDGKTGEVLWRFGEHGNVAFDGAWPQGGLHAPVPLGPDRVLCYNNGAGKPPRSRAQIYSVKNKTATLETDVEVDTDYSSRDRSNVELLPDGKTLMFASTVARKCVFTDLEGKPLKVISRTGISYRSHWFPTISY